MRIVFSCGGRLVPSSRFRVGPIIDYFTGTGRQVHVIYGYGVLDSRIRSRLIQRAYRAFSRLLRAWRTIFVGRGDLLIVQRPSIPFTAFPELIAARRGATLIFDFDDAIFLGRLAALRASAFQKLARQSAIVVAGNSWLAERIPAGPEVKILPTCIDTDRYRPVSRPVNDVPIIGWMGTHSNLEYLYPLRAAFRRMRAAGLKFRVLLCCDTRNESLLGSLGAEFVKWSPENEISVLNSFDVGLMPLPDDDWSKGKCSFKAIQYMAVGIPAVASAVGFNRDAIADGVTGYLVDEGGDWEKPLRALLVEPSLRSSLGIAARARAIKLFDIQIALDAYSGYIKEIERSLKPVR